MDADMAKIGDDPTTLEWWKVCEPCQQPLEWEGPPPSAGGTFGDWWSPMQESFHCGWEPLSFGLTDAPFCPTAEDWASNGKGGTNNPTPEAAANVGCSSDGSAVCVGRCGVPGGCMPA
jgi:hypothetical protein